jgi:hypothetical protein
MASLLAAYGVHFYSRVRARPSRRPSGFFFWSSSLVSRPLSPIRKVEAGFIVVRGGKMEFQDEFGPFPGRSRKAISDKSRKDQLFMLLAISSSFV